MAEKEKQGVPAVGFLVLAFTDENSGDQALKAMKQAKKAKSFYFEDAAVIRQDSKGKVHYAETGDMKTGKGAGIGALIGGIVGILGGPGGVILGTSAGAAIGGASAHHDAGFRDESLKTMGLALKPGTSAVVAITSDAFLKAVQKQVPIVNIRTFVANLSTEISNKLNEGKNVALGILLTEAGLAYKEVAVNENSAEVIGLAMTDEAVVAGQAYATADHLDYTVMAATEEGAVMEAGRLTAVPPEEEAKEHEQEPAEIEESQDKPAEV
jgi:uncharacterized membrane protein